MQIIEFHAPAPQNFDETPVERPCVPVEFSRKPEDMERMIQYLLRQPFPTQNSLANGVDDSEVVEEVEVESITGGHPFKLFLAVYDRSIEAYLPPR